MCIGVTDGIKVGVELRQGSAVGCKSGGAGGRKPAEVEVCNEDKRNRS